MKESSPGLDRGGLGARSYPGSSSPKYSRPLPFRRGEGRGEGVLSGLRPPSDPNPCPGTGDRPERSALFGRVSVPASPNISRSTSFRLPGPGELNNFPANSGFAPGGRGEDYWPGTAQREQPWPPEEPYAYLNRG